MTGYSGFAFPALAPNLQVVVLVLEYYHSILWTFALTNWRRAFAWIRSGLVVPLEFASKSRYSSGLPTPLARISSNWPGLWTSAPRALVLPPPTFCGQNRPCS